MNTIKTKVSSKAYVRMMSEIKRLIPQLHDNVRNLGKRVHSVLEINREKAMNDLVAMGLPVTTVHGLEKVGSGLLHEQIFLNGSSAAHLAESLKFKDQKLLIEKGVRVVVGGTEELPETKLMTLKILTTNRLARQLINAKEHRFYTIAEQNALRKSRQHKPNRGRFEARGDGYVIFHVRRWSIPELKTIVASL